MSIRSKTARLGALVGATAMLGGLAIGAWVAVHADEGDVSAPAVYEQTKPAPPPAPRPAAAATTQRVAAPVVAPARVAPPIRRVVPAVRSAPVARPAVQPAPAVRTPAHPAVRAFPSTGTGGLLDQGSSSTTSIALLGIMLGALALGVTGLVAYRRSR